MTDLVVMSLEPWDGVWRRNQHLISRLVAADRDLRVLFVSPPADPLHDVRSRRRPTWARGIRLVDGADRLWSLRPVKPLPRRVDPRADDRIARQVVRAARRLGMADPILWINDPGATPLAQRTGWRTLYDVTDDWLAADRPAAELERIGVAEEWLLANAGEVVVCSPELLRRKQPLRPGAAHPIAVIPNAVDAAAYRVPTARPFDLPPGRTAVYVGTLHRDRLDVDLCVATATALGGTGTLVLVGPNALDAADTVLLAHAGVALLGAKNRNEVVAYLRHADVLVVPHVVTSFTESLDPIKLYEYQAAGRPVISTPVAGFRDAGDPRITIAGASTFAAQVANAVAHDLRAHDAPLLPDWEERTAAMRETLERL